MLRNLLYLMIIVEIRFLVHAQHMEFYNKNISLVQEIKLAKGFRVKILIKIYYFNRFNHLTVWYLGCQQWE